MAFKNTMNFKAANTNTTRNHVRTATWNIIRRSSNIFYNSNFLLTSEFRSYFWSHKMVVN